MSKIRWENYVLLKGTERVDKFWNEYLKQKDRKVLFIMGKGFDIRMNIGIKSINNYSKTKIQCWVIEFNEGQGSASEKYKNFVDENYFVLNSLNNVSVLNRKINLWKGKGREKRRIGGREIAKIVSEYDEIMEYSDIVIDISAFPRSVYFSLIGKILLLIDQNKSKNYENQNLFILTAENAKIDELTVEVDIDEDINFTHGFAGGLELTSDHPIIWFPILGENKSIQIMNAHNKINPSEICPLLPFPAKDPRRSDKLIIEYHQLLFDELRIEPQNLLYVSEQNPFEVYKTLHRSICNFNETLSILNGCKAVISTFSSKLLSIGALLTAYEFNYCDEIDKIGVGILNVDSKGYNIDYINNTEQVDILLNESELYLAWLTGEPFNL